MLCADAADIKGPRNVGTDISSAFTELEEFSIYDAEVTVMFMEFGGSETSSTIPITTLSAGIEY